MRVYACALEGTGKHFQHPSPSGWSRAEGRHFDTIVELVTAGGNFSVHTVLQGMHEMTFFLKITAKATHTAWPAGGTFRRV